MNGNRTVTLSDQRDLERVAGLVSWLNRPSVERVVVTLPWLDRDEQERTAKVLRDLFNDCGCLWAGPTFLATFAGSLAIGTMSAGFSWWDLGASALIAVGAAVAAKLLGLAWSRWRLSVWLSRIDPRHTGTPEREATR